MGVYIKDMEMPKKDGSWATLRVFPDGKCFLYSWCEIDFDFMEHLTAVPAADVRPVVRGKWIDHQEGRWIYAKCSECGTVHDVKPNFCPSCGADMREPPKEE